MIAETSWVSTTPGVCGGEPCIRDTRHTVSGLVEWRRLGLTDDQILEHHPDLTHADLESAWDYYAKNGPEINRIGENGELPAAHPAVREPYWQLIETLRRIETIQKHMQPLPGRDSVEIL